MKHRVAGALAIILLISSYSVASAASVKIQEGSKCSKSGQVQVISGSRYTCTKTGSKLIWKAAPLPAPAIPLASSWSLDKPANSIEEILAIADKAIRVHAASTAQTKPNLLIQVGPKTNINQFMKSIKSLQSAAQLFSKDFSPSEPVTAVGAAINDYDFMYTVWEKQGIISSNFDSSKSKWNQWGEYCNQGGADYTTKPLFWGCVAPYSDSQLADIGLAKFGAHEYTHLVQGYLLYKKDGREQWGMPQLFQEGSADYFGVTLASTEANFAASWKQYRNNGYLGSGVSGYQIRQLDNDAMYKLLVDHMNGDTRLPGHWYFTGAYVTARLVAARGYDGFIAFMKEAGLSRDTKAAFQKVYETSFEAFAALVAPEVVKFSSLL